MNLLSDLLTPQHILLDVDVASQSALFEYVAQHLAINLGVTSEVIVEALFARERLGSTGLGHGVAMPHGRLKALKTAAALLVRLSHPIDFESIDEQPVRLLFILFVPARATDLHLQILGEMAQLLSDPQLRDQLMHLPNPKQVYNIFANWQAWS